MSKVLISSLIDEINLLLSRPVGSVFKKASPDTIYQREQLKQLRSHLEALEDDSHLGNLDKQYQALVLRLQGQSYPNSEQSSKITATVEKSRADNSRDKSKTDKLVETWPPSAVNPAISPVVSNVFNLFGAESDLIMENSTMTNGTPESNSTFVNDRMIASLQQAIQQTLQQVVKESVQQSVQQVVSQTLAVERALMVGEISANLNKIVEVQQRSQISQELITLNQQKQKLNAEISQLESDRANWMQQFQEFQSAQQDSLDRSLRSVNSYLQDQIQEQIQEKITDTLQQAMTGTVTKTVNQTVAQALQETLQDSLQDNLVSLSSVTSNPVVASPPEEEFVNKVQEQTDRFLLHLDEMFSSTFRSLEQDIQGYQTSLEAKLGHMETLEQKGEALINALVDRISQQTDSQTKTEEDVNVLSEFPDDIPSAYLETVAEPADENLINALLAGNEFGETIPEPLNESESEPEIEPEIEPIVEVRSIDISVNSSEPEITDENFLQLELNSEDDAKNNANDQDNEVDRLEQSIVMNFSELESLLGAPSDTLFDHPIETSRKSEPFVGFPDLDTNIIGDNQSAIAARELNPDFDLEAATQIVENFNLKRTDIEESLEESEELNLNSLAFPLEMITESAASIDDPDLLQWLEESSNRPNPANIAEVSADEELMLWLGNDAIDMAKLPTQVEPQATMLSSALSDLTIFNTSSSSSLTAADTNTRDEEKQEKKRENQVDQFFNDSLNNSFSDQADDSEESLILLTAKGADNSEFPEWEDSLVNELNSDLERFNSGSATDPAIAANLDQFIRNTPYALINWETEESQTYPTIIEVSVEVSNEDYSQPQPLVEPIIENPNVLFINRSAESLTDTSDIFQENLQSNRSQPNRSDEQSEIVIDIADLQGFPFASESSEIPEIFDNPESLFDSVEDEAQDHAIANSVSNQFSSNINASNIDDMDAIFAEVIAENATKYSQSTPFATNDELDDLFMRSLEPINPETSTGADLDLDLDLDNESELDTLLYGFDPATEIEQGLSDVKDNDFKNNDFKDFDNTTNLPVNTYGQGSEKFDTVMQELMRADYDGTDLDSETQIETITSSKSMENIEEELDTMLQGFVERELTSSSNPSEITQFVEISEAPTVLKANDANATPANIVQANDWSNALEEFELNLVQSTPDDGKNSQTLELSADEFFASLEYEKLNAFADNLAKAAPPKLLPDPLADLLDLEEDFEDEEENFLLNEFADAQGNGAEGNGSENEWESLINDLNSFNFNEPLMDDQREQLGLSSVAPITDTSKNVLDIDSLVMESRSMALIPPPPEKEVYSLDDTWILGIDFGSTAIRASLLNSNTGKVYGLYLDDDDEMPCKLVWTVDQGLDDPMVKDIRVLTKKAQNSGLENGEVALVHFKQFLKIGLPYRGVSAWQPILQWSDSHQASLRWLIAALKTLLEQIQTRANHPQLPDVGLILLKLSGVVFGYPSNWSDTYILNVREAVLKAGLVSQAEQVMAVEQTIAPVLSLMHDQKINQEITLLIDAGAVTTSLCLIKGSDLKAVERSKLHMRSLDYAGTSISQDIVVNLFYPHWQLITNPNRHLCKFDHLSLPAIGDSAPHQRILLQQYLLSSSLGQQMLELADRVKVTFGRDVGIDSWNEEIMGQPIVVLRRELENLILQPLIQRLNRELNAILSNAGILGEDIRQVLLLGSTMHIPLLSRWLAQKLPNASIDPLATSVVANGLAVSPLYPNLHDVARQQYSDYFLLQEICRLNLSKSINPNQLLQQLQMRGINIKVCRDRILSILQGDLPEGLFPWQEPDHAIVLEDPTLRSELFSGRLFEMETDGTYQPNVTKFQQLNVYLQAILGNMSQTLNEPLVFPEIQTARKSS